MAYQFKNNLNQGINLDLDQTRLPPNAAVFIKNLTNNVNINQGTPGGSGSDQFVWTPLEGNVALTQSGMPSGTNYTIGFYSSEQTNEGYFAVYNSNGNHTIWVIRGTTGDLQKVHQNTLLPFQLDPQYFLAHEGRITIELRSIIDPVTDVETNLKLLVFTNNTGFQGMIDVEASIATNSYATSYFTSSAAFYDRLELIHLGATLPIKCVKLNDPNPYTPTTDDASKQNALINSGWQFRIRTWDVWGRPSDWGIISSVFTSLIGGNCIGTSNGLPRCVNLCFDAGNPLVKFITVAYRRGVGNDPSGQTETGWFESETFRKYDDSTGVEWYNRPINPIFTTSGSGITFDATTNIITYSFCADKGANPVDPTEAARTQPGLPRLSGSVASIEKKLSLANNVYDFEPISQTIIDQVNFSVKLPTTSEVPCSAAPLRTITIYANLYNPYADYSPFLRKTFGIYCFGDGGISYGPTDSSCFASDFKLSQVFGDQTNAGFIAYLAGTPYKTVGKFGNYDPATGAFTEWPFPWTGSFSFSGIKLIQFAFVDVPAGEYVMRLASHHATINDGDLQKTSTTLGGVGVIGSCLSSGARFIDYTQNPIKEVTFDCSAGDINWNALTDQMFIILDLTQPGDSGKTNALDGYLYESATGSPIEMAPCWMHGDVLGTFGDAFGSFFTDHNGYYFATSGHSYLGINISVDFCTGAGPEDVFIQTSGCSTNKMVHGDGTGPNDPDYPTSVGNWRNRVYATGSTKRLNTFPDDGRRLIKQRFHACGQTTLGVPGIPVIMTHCQPALTDSNGVAVITAHNRYNYATVMAALGRTLPYGASNLPDYGSSPLNGDYLIFSQKGGCEWNVCDTCGTFIAPLFVPYVACGVPTSGCSPIGKIKSMGFPSAGSGYAIGDTFTVNGGSPLATGRVSGVFGSGVTRVDLLFGGEGYTVGRLATTATSGGGAGMTVDIFSLDPPIRTLCLTDISVSPNGVGIFGVQSGGKYPVAFWVHDVIGRHTSPQIKGGDLGYVFIPNLNDTSPAPYPAQALSQIQVVISSSLIIPSVFTHITFLVGANSLFYDFFSWQADWVQFIDNTGATNTTNPTSIRIYFQSLNEYNKQNNFGTNVAWDFVTQQPGSGILADIVQFIKNGDGSWIGPQKGAPVTYSKVGNFFTLDYQPELAGLQNGCLFRIIRPKQNTTNVSLPYYEQCLTLTITNGLLPAGTYTLPYQDSYLLSRSIPVPLMKGETAPIAPGTVATAIQYTSSNQNTTLDTQGFSENNVNNSNGVVIFQVTDTQQTFPFFFESPSPSDLWGSHLASQGRVGVPNQYQQQYREGTEIAVSNPLADRGIVNGIGTFLPENRQVFDRNTFGDITVVIVEMGVCMVICNNDYFITRYNQSQVQIADNGQLYGQNPAGQLFTSPQTKVGSNYGVIAANINSIQRHNGIIVFLDNKGHLIFSNFSESKTVEREGYMAYLLQKISITNIANLTPNTNGKTYWNSGIDPKTMEYVLTNFNIPVLGSPSYINSLSVPTLVANETYVFDLYTGILKSFASFTPEFYGRIPGYFLQPQFLSFKNGVPYIHHNNFANNVAPPAYCNFFGVQCEVRITHIVNGIDGKLFPDKAKRFLYNEIYCRESVPGAPGVMPSALWFADVITSEKGQVSRLLVGRWDLKDGYQCAAYLCAINTPPDPNRAIQTGVHAILDGDPLQGMWLQVSFTNNTGWGGSYFEVTDIVSYTNGVEKSAD